MLENGGFNRNSENWTIEVLGAVGGEVRYTPEQIGDILSIDQTKLEHGGRYTGRPTTKLHVGEKDIVKLRPEAYQAPAASVVAIAMQALKREQTYQVHHPDKTWFVIHVGSQTTPVVGNVCPLLTPLHMRLMDVPENATETESALGLLICLCELYFHAIKEHQIRLDEGLSNFGITENRQLYYLDDDLYEWDNCVAFAHMLGVYFRTLPWVKEPEASQLGANIRQFLLSLSPSGQYIPILFAQLQDVFIPAKDRRIVFETLKEELRQREQKRQAFQSKDDSTIAILADIHANLPALDGVLDFLERENITQGIVLGDIVGYGPHPAECIDRIRASGFSAIKGNHDFMASEGEVPKGGSVTPHAKWALEWTLGQLTDGHREWLRELALNLEGDGWFAVHGAPIDPTFMNAYVYHMTYEANLDLLERRNIPLCFHGHTHIPIAYGRKKGVTDKCYKDEVLQLDEFQHTLVCPGSVGQTREGEVWARFGTYSPRAKTFRFHRLHYNVEHTIADMVSHNFPSRLIERLRQGT